MLRISQRASIYVYHFETNLFSRMFICKKVYGYAVFCLNSSDLKGQLNRASCFIYVQYIYAFLNNVHCILNNLNVISRKLLV